VTINNNIGPFRSYNWNEYNLNPLTRNNWSLHTTISLPISSNTPRATSTCTSTPATDFLSTKLSASQDTACLELQITSTRRKPTQITLTSTQAQLQEANGLILGQPIISCLFCTPRTLAASTPAAVSTCLAME